MKKRGQVTVFVIVAIAIVAVILLYLLWIQPRYFSQEGASLNFENCVEDAIQQAIIELGPQGGFVNPELTYTYNGEEIPYYCYTEEYYKTGVVQVPLLKQHFQENIKETMRDAVDACYSNAVTGLQASGYDVVDGVLEFNISIEPEVVKAEIYAPTTIGTQRFTDFDVSWPSPLYDLVMISTSILQFEASYGDAETLGFMNYYPGVFIEKIKRSEGTTIYRVEDKETELEIKFASRSIIWPAGYGVSQYVQ